MMQNNTGDGIICDLCGMQHSMDFVYYSFDFTQMNTTDWSHSKTSTIFSADLCERCMGLYRERVKLTYEPPKPKRFKCEVTGESYNGTFTWHHCMITKITVRMTGMPLICTVCSKSCLSDATSCQCGCNILRRDADVNTYGEYLEINFGECAMQQFKERVQQTRELGVAEWNISTNEKKN